MNQLSKLSPEVYRYYQRTGLCAYSLSNFQNRYVMLDQSLFEADVL